jgi:hypothetical protein
MKLVILGSRGAADLRRGERAVELSGKLPEVTEMVSGRARGVDAPGEEFA